MSDVITAEVVPDETTVSAVVQVGNSDIVDLMFYSHQENLNLKLRALNQQIAEISLKNIEDANEIYCSLAALCFAKSKSYFSRLVSILHEGLGYNLKLFASAQDAVAELGERFDGYWEKHYQSRTIFKLIGVKEGSSWGGSPWEINKEINIPDTVSIGPRFLLFDDHDGDPIRFTSFGEVVKSNEYFPFKKHLYTVDIPKEFIPQLMKLRSSCEELVKLYREKSVLETSLKDAANTKLKIAAKLTENLLAEAGFADEIKKIYSTIELTFKQAQDLVKDTLALKYEEEREDFYDEFDDD